MRRFSGLLVLLFIALPFSVSVVGCHHALAPTYCPGFSNSGPQVGQVTTITVNGNLNITGESLNYGQIGSSLSASATDCLGTGVSVASYVWGTSNMSYADINPATGSVCAGSWNRNTGGGVPDYTVCTPPATAVSSTATNGKPLVAYITATADGATSNPIAVYIHPIVGSITIGAASTNCSTDPTTNCCPANNTTISAPIYTGLSCVSQNVTAQFVARAFDASGNNITCQVGHIAFSAQSSSNVVSIDANGIATANQPGSTTILANISNAGSGSTAGFFSTCPPVSIQLTANGSFNPVNVQLSTAQALTTVVKDQNGNPITGSTLTFVSTSPQTLSTGSNTVNPTFSGSGTVTAICQPPTCNSSPYSQIGYLGNGKPVTSNGLTVTTAGTSSNQVLVASTQSLFFYSVDFTTSSMGSIFKLPYVPNSMVITNDGSTVYLGSTNVLMSVSPASGASTAIGAIPGVVLAVSPDGSTLVIADPVRGTTALYSNSGALETTYNGVGTRAQWTPDSTTVYIAAGNQMLVHSTFSGWTSTPVTTNYQDVAVTVPSYGAYFAAGTDTEGRTYCATSVGTAHATPAPAPANTFFPLADVDVATTQRVAATSDGAHILGEGLNSGTPSLFDIALTPPSGSGTAPLTCTLDGQAPVTFTSTPTSKPLPIPASSVFTAVVPATNSSIAFFNYSLPTGATPTKVLPYYIPSSSTPGSLSLSGTATAPVAGVFSTDNKTFYTTTQGDNALHIITVTGTSPVDSSTILPNLTDINGNQVTPNLIVQRVRRSTS